MTDERHPRDRYWTLWGRKPVLEALADPQIRPVKLVIAEGSGGGIVQEIVAAAARRGVEVERVPEERVHRLSRHAQQDQGVALDVEAPRMDDAAAWLRRAPRKAAVIALDGVTNPANVGLILRSVTGAGIEGVVLPRKGTAGLSALVLKASAGIGLRAPILKCETLPPLLDSMRAAGFEVLGLRVGGDDLATAPLPDRAVFVLGGETDGVSEHAARRVQRWLGVPLSDGVESLNVACAATLVAFEVARRRRL